MKVCGTNIDEGAALHLASMDMKKLSFSDRMDIALRTIVATAGGYAFVSLLSVAMTFYLPIPGISIISVSLIISILLWPIIFIMSFLIPSLRSLLIILLTSCMIVGIGAFLHPGLSS